MSDSDDTSAPAPAPDDVVLLHSPTDDGEGARVIRAREGRVEVGELRPLKEGRPLSGEVVSLTPRADAPRVCDVKVHVKVPTPAEAAPNALAHKGPARVTSTAYRDGWDALFGAPPAKGPAN
jgi:hypothetical protein